MKAITVIGFFNILKRGDYEVEHLQNIDCFGSIVKFSRQAKGMTQSQLAQELSISTRYLKAIENSGRKPSYDLLSRIIHALDISANTIFYTAHEEHEKHANVVQLRNYL